MRIPATAVTLAIVAVSVGVFRAQTTATRTPTFEWTFNEGRAVGSVPSTQWLTDGTLMVFDARPPAAPRAFEILDLATGARRQAFDMTAAVASLNALRLPSATQQVLTWPQALDASGRRALYILDGDLFLLDIPASKFSRLTSTPV